MGRTIYMTTTPPTEPPSSWQQPPTYPQ